MAMWSHTSHTEAGIIQNCQNISVHHNNSFEVNCGLIQTIAGILIGKGILVHQKHCSPSYTTLSNTENLPQYSHTEEMNGSAYTMYNQIHLPTYKATQDSMSVFCFCWHWAR